MVNLIGTYNTNIVSKRYNIPATEKVANVQFDVDAPRINVYDKPEGQKQHRQNQYQNYNPFFSAHILREAENYNQEADQKGGLKAYSGVTNNYQNLLAII